MWYDTRFGRLICQFGPGSIVVVDKPRCKAQIAQVNIVVKPEAVVVKYNTIAGNEYYESRLWKDVDALRAEKRIDFLKEERALQVGIDVFPLRVEKGSCFVEPTTKLIKVEVTHAPAYYGLQVGNGWVYGVQKVFHCSNNRAYFENSIYETYVEALRVSTLINSKL